MDPTEAELTRAVARGSRDAAAQLFERYWADARRMAHAVCGREAMADDVAQDAMVHAFASIRGFSGRTSVDNRCRAPVVHTSSQLATPFIATTSWRGVENRHGNAVDVSAAGLARFPLLAARENSAVVLTGGRQGTRR
jgi:Sigma-70 region 2